MDSLWDDFSKIMQDFNEKLDHGFLNDLGSILCKRFNRMGILPADSEALAFKSISEIIRRFDGEDVNRNYFWLPDDAKKWCYDVADSALLTFQDKPEGCFPPQCDRINQIIWMLPSLNRWIVFWQFNKHWQANKLMALPVDYQVSDFEISKILGVEEWELDSKSVKRKIDEAIRDFKNLYDTFPANHVDKNQTDDTS